MKRVSLVLLTLITSMVMFTSSAFAVTFPIPSPPAPAPGLPVVDRQVPFNIAVPREGAWSQTFSLAPGRRFGVTLHSTNAFRTPVNMQLFCAATNRAMGPVVRVLPNRTLHHLGTNTMFSARDVRVRLTHVDMLTAGFPIQARGVWHWNY